MVCCAVANNVPVFGMLVGCWLNREQYVGRTESHEQQFFIK